MLLFALLSPSDSLSRFIALYSEIEKEGRVKGTRVHVIALLATTKESSFPRNVISRENVHGENLGVRITTEFRRPGNRSVLRVNLLRFRFIDYEEKCRKRY